MYTRLSVKIEMIKDNMEAMPTIMLKVTIEFIDYNLINNFIKLIDIFSQQKYSFFPHIIF